MVGDSIELPSGEGVGSQLRMSKGAARPQDPGEVRELKIVVGPAGPKPVFCDYISLSSAALEGSIFWFFSFLLQCTMAGDDGRHDGQWQGLN